MKKVFLAILTGMAVVSLAACGSGTSKNTQESHTTQTEQSSKKVAQSKAGSENKANKNNESSPKNEKKLNFSSNSRSEKGLKTEESSK